MSSPDDHRFRPGDPAPDDYDVGEEYVHAPPPGFNTPAPYGAVEDVQDEPAQTEPRHSSPATPRQPSRYTTPRTIQRPAQPYPSAAFQPGPKRTPRRGWSTLFVVGAFVLLVVVALVGTIVSNISGGGDADPFTTPPSSDTPEDITQVWTLAAADLAGAADEAEFAWTPDGSFTGAQLIVGESAWAAVWVEGESPAGIVAVDPADGTVLWERPLTDVLCANEPFDGALQCLARDRGAWIYHRIDMSTGEDLVMTDTSLDQVQTVHANAEVLVAVGPANPAPHAQVTGLAPDGTELWSFDIADQKDAEVLFAHFYDSKGEPVLERPRWRDLDGGVMMLWSTPGVAIIDPLTGQTFVHSCRGATPVRDHYLCRDDAGLHRYGLDGTVAWTLPDASLTVPEDRSDARPVALTEPTANQYEVVPVDWATGEITGAATYRFAQQPGTWTGIVLPPSAYTLTDATIILGDTVVLALDPETGELLWTLPLDEIYVGDIFQIGDVAVVDTGSTVIGIDIATGRIAWTRSVRGADDLVGIGDVLATTGFDSFGVLEVPQR